MDFEISQLSNQVEALLKENQRLKALNATYHSIVEAHGLLPIDHSASQDMKNRSKAFKIEYFMQYFKHV